MVGVELEGWSVNICRAAGYRLPNGSEFGEVHLVGIVGEVLLF